MELMNVNIPSWSDLRFWLPEAVLCLTFLAAILGDLVFRGKKPVVPFALTVIGMILSGVFAIQDVGSGTHTIMGNLIVVDGIYLVVAFLGFEYILDE